MRGLLRLAAALGAVLAVLSWRMRTGSAAAEPPWLDREPRALATLARWHPARPATATGRAAATLWAAPMSLGGLAVAAASPGRRTLVDGALVTTEARGPVAGLLARRGFRATTLGQAVLVRGVPSAPLLAHELSHVRQAERLGPAFAPLYLALLAVYGYRAHPLERAARSAGSSLEAAAGGPSPSGRPEAGAASSAAVGSGRQAGGVARPPRAGR
ncbi:MAG: hypothetical protein ACQETV_09415 [Actinomycetota bacterium]